MESRCSRWPILLFFGGLLVLSFYLRAEIVARTVFADHPLRADAKQHFTYAFNLRHNQVYSFDAAGLVGPEKEVRPDAFRNPAKPPHRWTGFERK
jgi:hypothetical protein